MIPDVSLEKNIKFFYQYWKKIWEFLKNIFLKLFPNDSDWKGLLFAQILNNLF